MSCKTSQTIVSFCLVFVGSIVFLAPSWAQNESSRTGHFGPVVSVQDIVLLGQDDAAEKPGLFDRMKRAIANWAQEHEMDDGASPHGSREQPRPQSSVAIPTRPPKPIRVTEAQKSGVEGPAAAEQSGTERRSRNAERRPPLSRDARPENLASSQTLPSGSPSDEVGSDAEETSIFKRLEMMREQVFSAQDLEASMARGAVTSAPRTAPSPSPLEPTRESLPTPTTVSRRTPPPQTSIDEIIGETQQRRAAGPTEVEQREQVVAERMPTPLQAPSLHAQPLHTQPSHSSPTPRTQAPPRAQRQPRDNAEPVRNDTRTATPTPGPRADHSTPLSGIEVPRSPASVPLRNQTAPRAETPQASPTKNPEPTYSEEYRIPSRRMLTTETTTAPNAATVETLDVFKTAEKTLMVSPRLEVETESDSKAIVGQEAEYRIRVFNRGGAPAEQVVLSVGIPEWIDIRQPDVSDGTTSIIPQSDNDQLRDFTWKLSRIEPNANALLVLRLVPKLRRGVEQSGSSLGS